MEVIRLVNEILESGDHTINNALISTVRAFKDRIDLGKRLEILEAKAATLAPLTLNVKERKEASALRLIRGRKGENGRKN